MSSSEIHVEHHDVMFPASLHFIENTITQLTEALPPKFPPSYIGDVLSSQVRDSHDI